MFGRYADRNSLGLRLCPPELETGTETMWEGKSTGEMVCDIHRMYVQERVWSCSSCSVVALGATLRIGSGVIEIREGLQAAFSQPSH